MTVILSIQFKIPILFLVKNISYKNIISRFSLKNCLTCSKLTLNKQFLNVPIFKFKIKLKAVSVVAYIYELPNLHTIYREKI